VRDTKGARRGFEGGKADGAITVEGPDDVKREALR
jgi:hypothetical protein